MPMQLTRLRGAAAFLAATGSILLAACGGSTSGGGQGTEATGEPVVIGSAISLSGSLAKEGGLAKQGYDLWLDWINAQGGIKYKGKKHPVKILYEDDTSKSDLSATLAQKLITEEKAQFLLGPYGSAATATVAVVAEKNAIPMLDANGAAESIFTKGYKYTFGVISPSSQYMKGVIDMAAAQTPRPTSVALLSADDNFSQEVSRAAEAYAPTKGMQVVFNQKYPNGSTDLTSLVSQAKTKNPDLLINSGHLAEAIAIHKAARDLKMTAKLYAYSVGPSTPDFVTALGKDAEGVVSGTQWNPDVKTKPEIYLTNAEYVAAYRKKYSTSEAPDYHVAEGTAACLALQKAIENADSVDPDKVRDALAKLDLKTFFGEIKFDAQNKNVTKPMVVEQIQGGQHNLVWPPDVAPYKPKYPAPSFG